MVSTYRVLDPSDPVSMYEFISTMPQDQSLDGVRLGTVLTTTRQVLATRGGEQGEGYVNLGLKQQSNTKFWSSQLKHLLNCSLGAIHKEL